MTDITTTAKELADWITGLEKTSADYESKRKSLPDHVGVVDELIGYFSEQITDPRKYSAPALLDALTGENFDKAHSRISTDAIDFAKQLKTELSSEEVTNLGSYFGGSDSVEASWSESGADVADVIVDGLRVLKNLNAVKTADAGVKAKLETGNYTDNKGAVKWYSLTQEKWKNDHDVSAFLHDSALWGTMVVPGRHIRLGDDLWLNLWVVNTKGKVEQKKLLHDKAILATSTTTSTNQTISWF